MNLPNLMRVQFWLWGIDAKRGDLEARGFSKTPHPEGRGSSIYRNGNFGLHSSMGWLILPNSTLLYTRARDQYFQTQSKTELPYLPKDAEPVSLEEGWNQFLPYVRAHEAWIHHKYGLNDRLNHLQCLPINAQNDLIYWKEALLPQQLPVQSSAYEQYKIKQSLGAINKVELAI